jgi:hypothetical protein
MTEAHGILRLYPGGRQRVWNSSARHETYRSEAYYKSVQPRELFPAVSPDRLASAL